MLTSRMRVRVIDVEVLAYHSYYLFTKWKFLMCIILDVDVYLNNILNNIIEQYMCRLRYLYK